jgi:hypothetical protein
MLPIMPLSLAHLSKAVFDGASPQGRVELLRSLEHAVQRTTQHAVEDAMGDLLAQLAQAGWTFSAIPGDLPYALQDPHAPGGPVTLRSHWMGSTSILQAAPAPPLSPEQVHRKALQDEFHDLANHAFGLSELHGFNTLEPRQRHALLLEQLQSEVLNGGFGQYFHNSAGDHALETLEVLQGLKARKTARLLTKACALFPDATPARARRARTGQLRKIRRTVPQPFAQEDAAFDRTGEDLAVLFMTRLDADASKPRRPRGAAP